MNSIDQTPIGIEPEKLEQLLLDAEQGDRSAVKEFYSRLLDARVFVPLRAQKQLLSDQAHYPNSFFSLLALQAEGRSVVPCFTREELILEWCGLTLAFEKLPVSQLIQRLPERWWIVINPGQQVEKELSPWEIAQLMHGSDAVDGLVEEATIDLGPDPEQLFQELPADGTIFDSMKGLLLDRAGRESAIETIFILQQQAKDSQTAEKVYVGVELSSDTQEQPERLQSVIEQDLFPLVVGATDLRVLVTKKGSLMAGLFLPHHRIFQKQTSLASKLRRWLFFSLR